MTTVSYLLKVRNRVANSMRDTICLYWWFLTRTYQYLCIILSFRLRKCCSYSAIILATKTANTTNLRSRRWRRMESNWKIRVAFRSLQNVLNWRAEANLVIKSSRVVFGLYLSNGAKGKDRTPDSSATVILGPIPPPPARATRFHAKQTTFAELRA